MPRYLNTMWKDRKLSYRNASKICATRVKTFNSRRKEPDTIGWLETLEQEDVLFDVGANIGIYTLPASLSCKQVIAFEPEALNYYLLCDNLKANKITNVIPYCIALSSQRSVSCFHVRSRTAGDACHSFEEPLDHWLRPTSFPYVQGAVSFSLDELALESGLPFPTALKIDVDGQEPKIIEGGKRLLVDERFRSLNVEFNNRLESHQEMREFLLGLGFTLLSERLARSGKMRGIGNLVFGR